MCWSVTLWLDKWRLLPGIELCRRPHYVQYPNTLKCREITALEVCGRPEYMHLKKNYSERSWYPGNVKTTSKIKNSRNESEVPHYFHTSIRPHNKREVVVQWQAYQQTKNLVMLPDQQHNELTPFKNQPHQARSQAASVAWSFRWGRKHFHHLQVQGERSHFWTPHFREDPGETTVEWQNISQMRCGRLI